MACEICGKEDLFSAVTGEPVCAICTLKFGVTKETVTRTREQLGLLPGEFITLDHGKEAAAILGKGKR